jgi:hypothetical protein
MKTEYIHSPNKGHSFGFAYSGRLEEPGVVIVAAAFVNLDSPDQFSRRMSRRVIESRIGGFIDGNKRVRYCLAVNTDNKLEFIRAARKLARTKLSSMSIDYRDDFWEELNTDLLALAQQEAQA